ncbi:MAG TPA: hypothetical protein VEW42_05185 [Candidatus Eisenbacteria bacterium]|nr:hypothetical protein [Candidatus Eisenbacteria bacterium]
MARADRFTTPRDEHHATVTGRGRNRLLLHMREEDLGITAEQTYRDALGGASSGLGVDFIKEREWIEFAVPDIHVPAHVRVRHGVPVNRGGDGRKHHHPEDEADTKKRSRTPRGSRAPRQTGQ